MAEGVRQAGTGGGARGLWIPAAAVVVAAAALGAYWNSLNGPFVYDDLGAIPGNATLRTLRAALVPPPGVSVSGRPVANLSLAINWALGGTRVWGYHLANVLIHLSSALALLGIVRRTLCSPRLAGRFGRDALPIALFVALIWVLHPLQSESVAYVVQRVESLMGLFYLLTLYCFIRSQGASRPAPWLIGSLGACLLGMATKEVMATAPLMVLLYDRTFCGGGFRASLRARPIYYASLAATWAVLVLLVAGTGFSRGGSAGFGHGVGAPSYWFAQCGALARYLRLAVWPHPLVFNYGTALLRSPGRSALGILLVAPIVAATAAALARRPALGFLGAWFLLILAPSSLVPVAEQTMAEHRMYLPLAAVCAAAVLGLYAILGRRSFPFLALLAAALGFLTWSRNLDYSSTLRLWQGAVRDEPGSECARSGYGMALAQSGRLAEAIAEFEEAVRLVPGFAEAQNNLGVALCVRGDPELGIGHFRAAIAGDPAFAEAHFNLGKALDQTGRKAEALQEYGEAVRLRPGYAEAANNLGLLLCEVGRLAEGVARLEESVRADPGDARAHASLATAYMKQGRRQDAAAQFERVVELNPSDSAAKRMVEYLRGGP